MSDLPEKGKDVIAEDKYGDIREVFLCACPNVKCKEWRCSLTGNALMFYEPIKWNYKEE